MLEFNACPAFCPFCGASLDNPAAWIADQHEAPMPPEAVEAFTRWQAAPYLTTNKPPDFLRSWPAWFEITCHLAPNHPSFTITELSNISARRSISDQAHKLACASNDKPRT